MTTELRERKKGNESNNERKPSPKEPTNDISCSKEEPPLSMKQVMYGFFGFISIALFLTLSVSHIVTGSLTFGYKTPSIRKLMSYATSQKTFTLAELGEYDGTDPKKPIYLAISGYVFDVTAGKAYGKDGGYHFFSGKDASRAYITGCFKDDLTHDLRGLKPEEIKGLETWVSFYKNHMDYFLVGKVLLPEIDESTPVPKPCNPST